MRQGVWNGMAEKRFPPLSFAPLKGVSGETQLLCGGLLVLGGSFLYPYLESFLDRVNPGCLFHRVSGLPGLLCGMTRSLAATAHGRLAEAFRLHLLGPPLFATCALLAEKALGRPILPKPGKNTWKRLSWIALVLLTAAWVAKLAAFGVNV